MWPEKSACGHTDVPVPDRLGHLIDPDPPGSELARIDLHMDSKLLRSEHTHLRYSVDGRDALRYQGIDVFLKCPHWQSRGGQAQERDGRIGRIALAERGGAGHARRKPRRGRIDGGDHIHRRAIDASAQIELKGNLGAAERADGSHGIHTRDTTELTLERR